MLNYRRQVRAITVDGTTNTSVTVDPGRYITMLQYREAAVGGGGGVASNGAVCASLNTTVLFSIENTITMESTSRALRFHLHYREQRDFSTGTIGSATLVLQ